MRAHLFLGLLLIELAFWKGDGGYLDLREYLDDAERLWLKGDLRLPAEPGAPPQYNRYSLGLQVLSGPLMLVGAGVQAITQGAIGRRAIAALTVPLLAALAGVLLFEIALLLNASKRIGICAAIIYCLGSPHLTFSRFYYAEAAIECGILLSVWSYLKFHAAAPTARGRWALLCGAGLAAAGASHYPHAPLVADVWFCLAMGMFGGTGIPACRTSTRLKNIFLFALIPAFAAAALVALNLSRYGKLVPPRYQVEVDSYFSLRYIPQTIQYAGRMLLRTPWFAPALLYGAWSLRRKADSTNGKWLAGAMLSGASAQLLFFLCYYQLQTFPARYLHPMSALAAVGLPFALNWLDAKLPKRGVACAMLVLLLSNAFQFLGDTGSLPFQSAPSGGGILACVWYMQPASPGAKFDSATPAGVLQFAIFAALILSGAALLLRAASL
ncbi:MAG TPA: phospholipid carrier-dependent glycosyltransferase, partial [Planctomycetota bacterium]|nr:phospholipid carrier-dependent glycosyltransferase [Planctomycetota bacterium]